jgi:hypothetical protein
LKLIIRIISYLTYICWEIENFVIKSVFLGNFSFVRIFLKNYRVTMTTTLDTSCWENTMVLSARRGFLHACIFMGRPRSASEGRLQLDGGFLKNEAIHCYTHKSNCQVEPMKITLPSYCEATHFHCNRYFLLNKKREGKLSENISFPIRFSAWTCLKNAFWQKDNEF